MLTPARILLLLSSICLLSGCGGDPAADAVASSSENGDPSANAAASSPANDVVDPKKQDGKTEQDKVKGGDDSPKGNKGKDKRGDKTGVASTTTPAAGNKPAQGTAVTAVPDAAGAGGFLQAVIGAVTGQPATVSMAPGDIPASPDAWTDQTFEAALRLRSDKFPAALKTRAAREVNSPQFAALLQRLLDVSLTLETPAVAAAEKEKQVQSAPASRPQRRRKNKKFEEDDDDGGGFGSIDLSGLQDNAAAPKTNPGNPAAAPAAGPVMGTLSNEDIARSISAALVINGTTESWSTLHAMLHRQQPTPVDLKQTTIIVFEEIFSQPELQVDKAIAAAVALVNSDDVTLPGHAALIDLARKALAERLHLQGYGPADVNDSVNNGRLVVNRSRRGRKDKGEDDERRAFRLPQAAPAEAAAVEAPTLQLKLPGTATDQMDTVLRSEEITRALQARLQNPLTFSSRQDLLVLASLLPSTSVRHASYLLFDGQHSSGADALLNGRMYQAQIRDPAHLLVLKSLPRQRSEDRVADPASVSWAKVTWECVQALRDQLAFAAKDATLNFDGPLPLRFHRGAVPEVAVRLSLDDGYEGTSTTPAGTQIFYARTTVAPTDARHVKKISDHYESRTKGIRRELVDQGVLWFDGIREGDDGTRMTMDVIVRRASDVPVAPAAFGAPAAAGNPAAGSAQRFTIESITVIAADPRDAPVAPEVESVETN